MKVAPESYSLTITADATAVLILAEALADWDLGVCLPDDGGPATMEIFCATRAEAKSRLCALRARAPRLRFGAIFVKSVKRQDWAESWKRFFHAQRVSERIVVRPSWEPVAAQPADCIVEINPGLSFGTGLHGTTRACLRFLDAWQRRQPLSSVLDMGCGTGILAIAAAKLGFPRVSALDNDPVAVRVARANALCNGVANRMEFIQADAFEFKADRAYDLVVANLQSGILVQRADRITAAVSRTPGSGLVVSGILERQYEAVRSAYVARGFDEQDAIILEGWKTGCFGRPLFPGVPTDGTRAEPVPRSQP